MPNHVGRVPTRCTLVAVAADHVRISARQQRSVADPALNTILIFTDLVWLRPAPVSPEVDLERFAVKLGIALKVEPGEIRDLVGLELLPSDRDQFLFERHGW
jgi:hypothetical protein